MIGARHEFAVEVARGGARAHVAAHPSDVLAGRAITDAVCLHHREHILAAAQDRMREVIAVDHVVRPSVHGDPPAVVASALADVLQGAAEHQGVDAIAGPIGVGQREQRQVTTAVRAHHARWSPPDADRGEPAGADRCREDQGSTEDERRVETAARRRRARLGSHRIAGAQHPIPLRRQPPTFHARFLQMDSTDPCVSNPSERLGLCFDRIVAPFTSHPGDA